MKKILLGILLVLFLASPALAESPNEWVTTSGVTTSDGTICDEACYLHKIVVSADGGSGVTTCVYDSTGDQSGVSVVPAWSVYMDTDGNTTYELDFDPPVYMKNGIVADFTCTGTFKAVFYYRKR